MVNPILGERLLGAASAVLTGLSPDEAMTLGEVVDGAPESGDLPPGSPVALLTKVQGTMQGEILLILDADLAAPLRERGPDGLVGAAEPIVAALAAAMDATSTSLDELSADVALARVAGKADVSHIAVSAGGRLRAILVFCVVDLHPEPVVAPVTLTADLSRIGLLRDVSLSVTVELGRSRITIQELLSLTPGAVVELDREVGSLADLLVNGTLIARGEVVVVEDTYGIRISEIISSDAEGA